MTEYRVQTKNSKGEWGFETDRRGKFYVYFDEKTAKKFGPQHAGYSRNPVTNMWEQDLDNFRIVKADINWEVVDA